MNAVTIENLRKVYKNGVVAVNDLNLTIQEGDFFGFLGPNGAGKSTTIGVLCSLVSKTSGKVKIFNYDIDHDFSRAKSYLGVVPQEFNFNAFETPIKVLITQAGYFGISYHQAKRNSEIVLKQFELWDKRHEQIRTLSGGMRRRLMFARALVHEPRLLILDEPTAGMDIEIRRSSWQIMRNLNEQGITIILTTHYLEEVESLCKNIAIINQGNLIEHADTKTLINKMGSESFVLDLRHPINKLPHIDSVQISLADPATLNVDLPRSISLNELFTALSQQGIEVSSMRNKTNRLEELFVKLTTTELT